MRHSHDGFFRVCPLQVDMLFMADTFQRRIQRATSQTFS
jgi:hypothetical protein